MAAKKEKNNDKEGQENKPSEESSSEIVESMDLSEKENESEDQNQNDENDNQNNKEQEQEAEITNLKEEKIRILAEMDNLRKRFEKEKIDSIKFGSSNIIREMLSPGDNLERALAAIPAEENFPDAIKNLIEGLKMVQREFASILEKNGVTKIESLNKKFDHNYHQAMMEVESEEVEEGTVVQEIQPGYMMHDRLLRPAMVGVAKKITKDNLSKNKEK